MKRGAPSTFPRFHRGGALPFTVEAPEPWRPRPAPMAHGALTGAGVVQREGPGAYAVSCGGCSRASTLSRGLPDAAAARKQARSEGWSYGHPFGWLCPSCRFGFGVDPIPEEGKPQVGHPAPMAPRRRVVMNVYSVTDSDGNRVGGFGELLSCGHTFVPSDGTRSGNRTRRCPDCLAEGRGAVK